MPVLAVLGMHRSYTSLASRWLSDCGLEMGDEFLESGVGNSDGHFEDIDFLHLHEHLLRKNDLPATGLVEVERPHFPKQSYADLQIAGDEAARAIRLLQQKTRDNRSFGWKEPRTCLFLPFYRATVDLRSLVLFRPYDEVVASLVSREPEALRQYRYPGWRRPIYWLKKDRIARQVMDMRHGYLEAWIHYNECLLEHIEATPRSQIMVHDLESLNAQDETVIARLRDWGFDCSYKPLGVLTRSASDREPLALDKNATKRASEIERRFRALIAN